MVEILISLIMITVFITILMRYQSQALKMQAQAIVLMKSVDQLEAFVDGAKLHSSVQDFSSCPDNYSPVITPVTVPCMRGAPLNLSLCSCMKVLMISLPKEQGESGSYQLPFVFKGNCHEDW